MRHPAVRNAPWLRRAAAVAGAAGLILGPALLPAAAQSVRVVPAGPAAAAAPAASQNPAVTVTGKHLYDPQTKKPFPYASTVTVSQNTNLVNQMVQVSWTGFTPSNLNGFRSYSPLGTMYPVMVAECPGTAPKSLASCYGALNGGTLGSTGPYGPYNAVYAVTTPQGTGTVAIQVETGLQNQALGCDQHHDCSLIILPIQGGNDLVAPPQCGNHSLDTITAKATTELGQIGAVCSFPYGIVVPLHFAPTPGSCPLRNADFTAEGSPLLLRAMNSWQTGLCAGRGAMTIQYLGTAPEPQARTDFLAGATDIGLTTQPATGPGRHPYTYAPVAVTAAAVAYWVDNPLTGQPLTDLKMDPRLLAKLVTTSYTQGYGCPLPPNPVGCDNAVDHNPHTIFTDPEFKQLNPQVKNTTLLYQFQAPTVQYGLSDMTWEVTRWIAANPDAGSFLAGQFDPWGMHVNTNFMGVKYPTQQFVSQDPFPVLAHLYNPVFPPSAVARYQVQNWDPSTYWILTPNPPNPPGYPAQPPEYPGNRDLFAIVDEADAAAFQFPSMAILNHGGTYVAPTQASMAAAVRDMTVNPDGITRDVNSNSTDPAQYPLTMVIYAMVPTGGISTAKAQKIARFLDFVAGRGQQQGTSPGQLPPGYLPLPASLRAQTLKAASEVLHQTGARPPGRSHGGGGGGGGAAAGAGTSPAGSGSTSTPSASNSSPAASPSSGPSGHTKASAAFSGPDTSGFPRLLLPILLIIGALLALAGPSAVVLGRPGGRAAVIAGWRRVTSLSYLPASLRGRKK